MIRQIIRTISIALLALSLLLIGLAAPPVEADIGCLNPIDDTFVDVDNPGQNFDEHEEQISVTATGFPLQARRLGYLRFDVQGIADADMQDVTLRVYNQLGIPSSAAIGIFSVSTDDWNDGAVGDGDETTLTYSNAPAEVAQLALMSGTGGPGWYVFHSTELTSYIKDQLIENGGNGWVTLRLRVTAGAFGVINTFEDRENGGGTGNPPELCYAPTAVTFSSFTATPGEDEILLEWETASEQNLQGFNLYRAKTPDGINTGTYVQLNDTLISGMGDPIQGASYDFPDEQVMPGVRYYYWLEDVAVGNVTALHGPVDAALAGHKIYLPLIMRH